MIECKSRKTAWRRAPQAAHIAKVEGGFRAFATMTEWNTWRRQR